MIIPLRENAEYPRLVVDPPFDEQDLAPHGYKGDVTVELADGESFPVYFYEPDAIREELDARLKSGFGQIVAEPGLVIIPEITLAAMKSSVLELIEIGYFAHLKSCEDRILEKMGVLPPDAPIEKRLDAVESELAALKARVENTTPPVNWVDRFIGAFKDNPAYDKAMEYGRQFREADRSAQENDKP
jgi:hypothetical protein